MATKKQLLERIEELETKVSHIERNILDRIPQLLSHDYVWNNFITEKNSIQIDILKRDFSDDKKKLWSELGKIQWQYLNPPQYKVGEKVGNLIITHINIISKKEGTPMPIWIKHIELVDFYWEYGYTNIKTGETGKLTDKDI